MKITVKHVIDKIFGFKNPYDKETYDEIIKTADKNIELGYIWMTLGSIIVCAAIKEIGTSQQVKCETASCRDIGMSNADIAVKIRIPEK